MASNSIESGAETFRSKVNDNARSSFQEESLQLRSEAPAREKSANKDSSAQVENMRNGDAQSSEKHSEREMKNLAFLQDELLAFKKIQLLSNSQTDFANGKRETPAEEINAKLNHLRTAMNKEYNEGQFGLTTRMMYQDAVTWLQQSALPDAVRKQAGLDLPIELPPFALNINGKDAGSYDMGISSDLNRKDWPSDSELDKLSAAGKWLTNTSRELNRAGLERRLRSEISENNLPPAWFDRSGESPEGKRQQCAQLVDLVRTVTANVKAMDFLHQAGGQFPLNLPSGCEVERDSNGNISKVNLDLPSNLELNNPQDEQKIKRLESWCNENVASIKKSTEAAWKATSGQSPLLSISEHQPVSGSGRVSFEKDQNGRIRPIEHAPGGSPVEDQRAKYNLVTRDYETTDLGDGKIKVTPTEQYWHVPLVSPHNVFKTAVGEKIEFEPQSYNANDFVPALKDGRIEMIQAKNLAKFHDDEQSAQNSNLKKGLLMDAVVSTALVGSGAYGLYSATTMLGAGGALLRTAFGLAGAMEGSAGAEESAMSRYAMKARTAYFLLDAAKNSLQLAGRFAGIKTAANTLEAAAEASTEVTALSGGKQALEVAKAMGSLAIDAPMNYVVVTDIWSSWEKEEKARHSPTAAAIRTMQDQKRARLAR